MPPGKLPSVVPALPLLAASLTCGCYFFVEPKTAPLEPGAEAPGFDLPDQDGERVTLASLLENGPAVIVFYSGYW
jgi:hypothetical protein